MPSDERRERLQQQAWIGDAVLTLFAREKIIKEQDRVDAELASRMTSNRFLSAFGEPTAAEAALGRIYQEHGLAYAFRWIEVEWMPLFERQREKRARGSFARRTRTPAGLLPEGNK
ncbi:MAG: hypothetical protein IT169_15855 [Bryobacterales bacterium]|nr:hypothetical protein [Bryobacterales bacterium]